MFQEVLKDTLQHEGFYANVIGDNGGETYRGIARNFHPDWQGWIYIDHEKAANGGKLPNNYQVKNTLLDNLISDFYYKKYWLAIKLDQVLDQSLQKFIFDFYVNSGGNAIKILQKVLNQFHGNNLVVDGGMGQMTLNAINKANPEALFNNLKNARIDFYKAIATGANAKFLPGWLKRANGFNYVAVGVSVIAVAAIAFAIFYFIYKSTQNDEEVTNETIQ